MAKSGRESKVTEKMTACNKEMGDEPGKCQRINEQVAFLSPLSYSLYSMSLCLPLFFLSPLLPFYFSLSSFLFLSLSLSLLSETGAMLGTGLGIATIALIGDSYVHTFAAFSTFTVLSLGSLSPYFLILLLFCTDF